LSSCIVASSPFSERHRGRAGDQTGNARQQNRSRRGARAGHAHYEAEVRDEPVVRAEHRGAQIVARGVAVPGLGAADVVAQRACAPIRPGDGFDDRSMTALFRRDRQRVGLAEIFAAIVELGRGDGRQHEARTEAAGERTDHACAQRWRERYVGHARGSQLVAPEASMTRLCFGELQKDVATIRIPLGCGESVVERRTVELVDEIGSKARDVVDRLHGVVSRL
jgi:hypothetical protein